MFKFKQFKVRLAKIIMIMGFIALFTGLVGFTSAQADDTPPPPPDEVTATVDTSTIVFGSIDEKATVSTVNAAGVTVNGMPVVAYVHSNPKHWDPKKAVQVPFAKNYWAGVRSGKPFRLHKGQKFPDTYVGMAADMTEHDVALTNRVKNAWQLFDFKAGEVRNRGFFTGKKWVGDCANPKPTGPPTITIDQVVVVKQRGSMKVAIDGSLELSGSVSGVVSVDCGSSSATARFSASADASLSGRVSVKAHTRQEAILKGEGALKMKFRQDAKLKLEGDAVLKLEGSATATCSGNQSEQPGSIVEVEDVNDVLYGNTRTWRIRGIVPEGQTATLRVSAQIGALPESDKVISLAAGPFDISVHYTAPTEGSSDTLTAKLFGSDGVKDDEKSDTFQLRANPVDPL